MNTKQYYVYILTNKPQRVLYIGVTNNLIRRVYEHRQKLTKGFSSKYNLTILVYYEIFDDINNALQREKRLKKWNRPWKIELIENNNPQWSNLYKSITK